jgi:hypothetical protein
MECACTIVIQQALYHGYCRIQIGRCISYRCLFRRQVACGPCRSRRKIFYWGVSKEIQPESNMIQMIGANPGCQWCRLIGAVVDEDSNAESHTMHSSSRMREKPASGVLASLRGSTYGTEYDSPLRSLRPCWTAFLRTLHGYSASSQLSIFVMATGGRMSFSTA